MLLLMVTFFFFSLECKSSVCGRWDWKDSNPHIYWINFNHTLNRRTQFYEYMNQVNFVHNRIKGFSYEYASSLLPKSSECKGKTSSQEVASYVSHIYGIIFAHNFYDSLLSTKKKGQYALFFPDDAHFSFQVDFQRLTKSAPAGFCLLQLASNDLSDVQSQNDQFLWIKSDQTNSRHDEVTLPVYLVDLSCVRRNAHLNNASRAVPESKSVVKSTLDQQLRRVVKNINITCGVVESKPFAHKLMANLLQPAYTSTLSLFHRYEGNANYTVLKPPSIWSDILSPAGLDCNSS